MNLPTRIGKYELQQFLGGGMSHVFRAQDTVLKRTVAVKILTDAGVADQEVRTRFLDEAETSASITHDNIIRTYDYGEENGRPFMVMEFLVGMDLRSAIQKRHVGDLTSQLHIAAQAARALEHVHGHRIVHRDIKPENLHLDAQGRVKLMDFGIAKREGISRTQAGFALGTPYYMAPEQVLGEPVTGQADVYSFGVLLYELVAGVKPITGDTVERLFYAILHEPLNVEPLRQAGVPEGVQKLIAHCTAKKPEARPQGFRPVIAELERLLNGRAQQAVTTGVAVAPKPTAPGPAAPAPAPEPPAWQRPGLLALAGVTLLAVIAAVYVAARPAGGPRRSIIDPPKGRTPAATVAFASGDMVLVEAGRFLAGPAKTADEIGAFYIDRTEVTNAAYAAFCQTTGRRLPTGFPAGDPQHPVVNVTIEDAKAFAAWAGKRLPSAREWERAARGTDGRLYPWGDTPDAKLANVDGSPHGPGLVAVTALEEGASPVGAHHLIGNAWEWTDTLQTPSLEAVERFAALMRPAPTLDEPWYRLKGGSFKEPLQYEVAFEWLTAPGRLTQANVGFRCAKTP